MGCDIHAVVEYERFPGRDGEEGTWSPAAVDCLRERDYYLFEAMAGVRGDEKNAVAPPRGFPTPIVKSSIGYNSVDACLDVAFVERAYAPGEALEIKSGEHHSASWLTLDEFERAVRLAVAHREAEGHRHLNSPDVLGVLALMRAYRNAGKNVRIVFNFDN